MFPSNIAGLGQGVLGKVTFWLTLAPQLFLRDYHQQSQNATVLGLLVITGFLDTYPNHSVSARLLSLVSIIRLIGTWPCPIIGSE
jgi:hypothetical protein